MISFTAKEKMLFGALGSEPFLHEITDMFPVELPAAVDVDGNEALRCQRMDLDPRLNKCDPAGQTALIRKLLVIRPNNCRLRLLMHAQKLYELVQKVVAVVHIVAQRLIAVVQIKQQRIAERIADRTCVACSGALIFSALLAALNVLFFRHAILPVLFARSYVLVY